MRTVDVGLLRREEQGNSFPLQVKVRNVKESVTVQHSYFCKNDFVRSWGGGRVDGGDGESGHGVGG